MITVLTGENSFEIDQALSRIVAAFDGTVERFDGSELELRQLPDLLMGATLFSDKRLVVIKGLAENKSVWNDLGGMIERVSDDVHLVLIDAKPDKRTATFKTLKKVADMQDFPSWTDRDLQKAETWAIHEAKSLGVTLDKKSARTLVNRVGADQWRLRSALEKLAVMDDITPEIIEDIIDVLPAENVFNLFEAALRRDSQRVVDMIRTLELTEDPFMVFGLLSGQAFQLAALAVTDKPSSEVAKDIGAHPYALSKLAPHARKFGRVGAKKVITVFAESDTDMKMSVGEPWLLIERALIGMTSL